MKKCRYCGREIINGENGCMLAGDVCFSCKPWRVLPVPSWQKAVLDGGCGGSYDAADYWEGQILARQDQYWND